MKICLAGVTGHINYVIESIGSITGAYISGLSAVSPEENPDGVYNYLKSKGHNPKLYSDYLEMLDAEKPDIVAVACVYGDNASTAEAALLKGADVFCEKPVATELDALARLEATYKMTGKALCGMFGLRFSSCFLTAKQLVDEGAVGKIRLMHAQKSYKLGIRPDFYRDRKRYGGTIPWVGSHAVDWLRWFSGKEFISVKAYHTSDGKEGVASPELLALCAFEMKDDIFASVSIDYLRPANAPGHGDDRIRIAGTEGVLEVSGGRVILINAANDGSKDMSLCEEKYIFEEFVRNLDEYRYGGSRGTDSFETTRACLLARESADTGKTIFF